jgi:hypothetical protein
MSEVKKESNCVKVGLLMAFNTIEHHSILKIHECKGFNATFLMWVHQILSSGS